MEGVEFCPMGVFRRFDADKYSRNSFILTFSPLKITDLSQFIAEMHANVG
jgi:hypothetical protein